MAIGHRRVGVMRHQRLGLTPTPALPLSGEREVPWSKLAAAGLHEIKPAAYRDAPAALAFALAFIGDRLVKREDASPLLWCLTDRAAREWGAPYGPGLISFGLDPALILIVQARNGMDAAWALGRRAEGPRLHRRSRPDRGEGADHGKTPRACRADEPHALPAPLRASGRAASPARSPAGVSRRSEVAAPPSMPQHQGRQLGISRSSAAGAWRRREVGPWSFVMSRMVSVWLPALPIERLKRMRNGKPFPVDRPFALVGSEDRGLLLTALNAAAMRAGLSSRHGPRRRPRHLPASPHRAGRTGERCRMPARARPLVRPLQPLAQCRRR